MSKAEDILEKFKKSFNTPSTKDEKLKVVMLCIVISTTFWFFNALNKNDYVTRINYPVSIQFDKELFVATAPLPDRIPIEVSGGGWDLMTRYFGFKMSPLELKFDNPDQNSYVMLSSLRGEIMPELEPLSINYFLQDSISFKVERRQKATIVLQVDTASLTLDDNYLRLSPVRISPSTIEVNGPMSKVAALGDTLWINADFSNVTENFQGEVNIPQLPELITSSQKTANVSFDVVRLVTKEISLQVQKVNFPSKGWSIDPERINLKYKIPENYVSTNDTSDIKIFVDFKRMNVDSTLILQKQVLNSQLRQIEAETTTLKAFKQ